MQRNSTNRTSVGSSRNSNPPTSTSSASSASLSLPPSNHSSNNVQSAHLSSTSPFLGKLGNTGDPALAKRRARNLLRDYYGLTGPGETGSPASDSDGAGLENSTRNDKISAREALSIDSPHFDADAYFNKLVGNSSLKSLLSTANELMSEIRELDGERQSLVYNHHHELVEASETIDKMKNSSLQLDSTLSQLQDSLSAISQLSTTLTSAQPPGSDQIPVGSKLTNSNDVTRKFESGLHLSALLSLPTVLRGILTTESKAAADQLWGEWEPALRSFEEAGIEGAKQIGNECRDVLRNAKSLNS